MTTNCTLRQDTQLIKNLIDSSESFLKIVAFRFDAKEFADMLTMKAKDGVCVEVITNPPDNVAKDKLRPIVEKMYDDMIKNGVALSLCNWEAGEPRLTTTSMSGKQSAGIGEKWYSLHLQLLINEKQVLVTSRPLTSEKSLDIYYLSSDEFFITAAKNQFDKIKNLFLKQITINGLTINGEVINFLDKEMLEDTLKLFKGTNRLNAKQYYLEKLPKAKLQKGIFISPFDGKMRDFLYDFIDSSEEYLYFFIETFFDEELIGKLQEKVAFTPGISIKIITSPPERIRQNPQKAKELIKQALSLGIHVSYLPDIQAKFWISDKWLAVPSGDFNRMNLGHNKGKCYWKSDTQLILLDDNKECINQMKKIFDEAFKPIDLGSVCAKDVDALLRRMVKSNNLSGSKDAREYLSRFKAALIIKTEQDVRYVIDLAIKLANRFSKRKLDGACMLMAIVLYNLQRREHRFEEITEKLENVESESQIRTIVKQLEDNNLILKSGDVYRLNINPENFKSNAQKKLSSF
ncbi:MAG: hypothetical protein ACPLKZ_01005 [Candidatus Bathyarchaeales archaeon]